MRVIMASTPVHSIHRLLVHYREMRPVPLLASVLESIGTLDATSFPEWGDLAFQEKVFHEVRNANWIELLIVCKVLHDPICLRLPPSKRYTQQFLNAYIH